MFIRNCARPDLARVCEIERASFADPYSLSFFETMLSKHAEGFRVAEIYGEIQAYCATFPKGDENALVISSIAVLPDFRRRGIASALVEDVISLARSLSLGSKRIILQVSVDNLPAQRLYTKFGFSYLNLIKNYYGVNRDAFKMELKLEV